jgi:hypothetical protein
MLKRYELKSEKYGGWAIIVLDTSIGYFSAVSDFGNYAYIWSSPGCEFRKFLTELEADYLCGKLLMGRSDAKVFDGEATKELITQHLKENKDWPFYVEEKKLLNSTRFSDQGDFEAWCAETRLDTPHEYAAQRHNPQGMGFCMRVWPRFVALLKKELDDEQKESTQPSDAQTNVTPIQSAKG